MRSSLQSSSLGTFCVKIVKQGPRGFICEYIHMIFKIVKWFQPIITKTNCQHKQYSKYNQLSQLSSIKKPF